MVVRYVVALGVCVLAAVLAGCGATKETNLSIEVSNGWGQQHYRLTCHPAGGDVPRPTELCQLLADNSEVALFRPKDKSGCLGSLGTVHLHVRGVFEGRAVDATEIDACEGNAAAERLWFSELPPPPHRSQ